jgi:fumarylacetoacetate (FAA) hydrolase family protein
MGISFDFFLLIGGPKARQATSPAYRAGVFEVVFGVNRRAVKVLGEDFERGLDYRHVKKQNEIQQENSRKLKISYSFAMTGCFSRESAGGREEERTTEQIQGDGVEQGHRPGSQLKGQRPGKSIGGDGAAAGIGGEEWSRAKGSVAG